MSKKKRTYNTRLIKATWPYTVQEIATLFGIHKNAPLRWLKEGLKANSDGRPFLIRGDELIRFLSKRQAKKHSCTTNQFYCLKCRSPQEAYLNIADIIFITAKKFKVNALCSLCSTPVSKLQSLKSLTDIQKNFNIQQLERGRIIESDECSLNSDLEMIK